MKSVINFISKNHNYKMVIGLVAGLLIASTGAYAITVASNTVTYDNTNSGLTSTNVQGAIDELYNKSNTKISDYTSTVRMLRNTNIVSVKKYDETNNSSAYCVTGDESICKDIVPGTYEAGTIVDYKVNDNTTKRFYVIHDDGETLTLQDQRNTVDKVAYVIKEDYIAAGGTESEWNSCTYTSGGRTYAGCNTRGPITILPALESATNSWTNVNVQTYTPGTTSFAGNNKTGCTDSTCSENTYTMTEHSARARIITIPEAWQVGCETWNIKTCPKYIYNYLDGADQYEGIISGNEDGVAAYFTMNTYSDNSALAWRIAYVGDIRQEYVGYAGMGARAVISINK